MATLSEVDEMEYQKLASLDQDDIDLALHCIALMRILLEEAGGEEAHRQRISNSYKQTYATFRDWGSTLNNIARTAWYGLALLVAKSCYIAPSLKNESLRLREQQSTDMCRGAALCLQSGSPFEPSISDPFTCPFYSCLSPQIL